MVNCGICLNFINIIILYRFKIFAQKSPYQGS